MTRDTKQSPPPITSKPLRRILASISTVIVLPYLLLTLIVATVGAFVVVRLVTGSLQERFNNQLLDAGRVVSEGMVDYEKERLNVLRAVVGTEGVAPNLAEGDRAMLAARVPQIIANSNTDAVELLDQQGLEIYGWQRPPQQNGNTGDERSGADFSEIAEVRRVLDGVVDEFGEKRVFLSETPYGLMIFTIGPVFINSEQVGAALVGTYLSEMVTELSRIAAARVTLYSPQGIVLETGLGGDQEGILQRLREPPEQYLEVLDGLQEDSNRYPVILNRAENQVPLDQVTVLGQDYSLAYGDWRLRNQSVGFFSVALPNNFIVTTAATSRNWFSFLFSLATLAVLLIGFVVARRIIVPLNRLVQTSLAVAQGRLDQRTGITRNDEIGSLAQSFDLMTERLEARNRELLAQASKLEAILDSTADGVIVLDRQGLIVTANPAAKRLLVDISSDFLAEILRDLPPFQLTSPGSSPSAPTQALAEAHLNRPKRYQIGSRVFSVVLAPMRPPGGEWLGTVIALRDVTREVEAEQLKDGFITTVSHQLRTPLTAIKGFSELLSLKPDNLTESQQRAVDTINRNVDRLARHINQIIEITEIQNKTLKLNRQPFCFSNLVREVAESWRPRMAGKELLFQVRLAPTDICVDGDSTRLTWAIDNLLSNACNYTLQGGQVTLALTHQGAQLQVEVVDTGIGIAVTDQPYLFTRFFRADHISSFNVDGVGLGLFITRTIVEMHGGQVRATSQLGRGSTFSLTLPILENSLSG